MNHYALDTNIVSQLVKRPGGLVEKRIESDAVLSVSISIIVAGEMLFGASKSGNEVFAQKIERVLAALTVHDLKPPVDTVYGEIRTIMESRGHGIGRNDLWIAAHALALDLTLVTDNVDEFSRVPGLRVENWLRDDV